MTCRKAPHPRSKTVANTFGRMLSVRRAERKTLRWFHDAKCLATAAQVSVPKLVRVRQLIVGAITFAAAKAPTLALYSYIFC